ncbi:MAG: TetR/AcrR family transcriptional regulator [Desulfomonilia bacterium]
MARKKDKAPLRRREILETFQQVLIEEGFEGASIAKIASRMGIHPSLIIHYFSTKEDMIVALVDYILETYERTFLKKLKEISDPRKRLETGLSTLFGVDWISLVDTRAFYACYYLGLRNQNVKMRLQKMYHRFRKYLIQEIGLYMESGLIPKTDPEQDADLIIALVEGLSFYRNISGGKKKYQNLGQYLQQKVLSMLSNGQGPR